MVPFLFLSLLAAEQLVDRRRGAVVGLEQVTIHPERDGGRAMT